MAERGHAVLRVVDADHRRRQRLRPAAGDHLLGVAGEAQLRAPLLADEEGENPGHQRPVVREVIAVGRADRHRRGEGLAEAAGRGVVRRDHVAEAVGADEVGVRPLNPEYFKTGKAKLVWKGGKTSAPSQLVVQGRGDFKTAFFDLAGGKEVELPVGDYQVIFGRVVVGKGARMQNATLYQGESQPFTVEEGKTFELKMGAPFQIAYTRRGDQNLVIDALKIFVRESSGCLLTELQGMPLAPEVLAGKADSRKAPRPTASSSSSPTAS